MREIEFKPSHWLGLLLAGMVGLALAALWMAAMPGWLQATLSAGLIGTAVWRLWRAHPALRLRQHADGRLQAMAADGEWRDIEVMVDTFVSPALVVMRYRIAGERPRALTLLPDSADADSLRRLRVSLRWASRIRSDTWSPGAD